MPARGIAGQVCAWASHQYMGAVPPPPALIMATLTATTAAPAKAASEAVALPGHPLSVALLLLAE